MHQPDNIYLKRQTKAPEVKEKSHIILIVKTNFKDLVKS